LRGGALETKKASWVGEGCDRVEKKKKGPKPEISTLAHAQGDALQRSLKKLRAGKQPGSQIGPHGETIYWQHTAERPELAGGGSKSFTQAAR